MQYPEDAIHDESYLHVMHEHIDPFIHNHNHAHTVYTRPADAPPKFDFLAVKNYLGEFKSDIDKARARFNLGIPDEFSFNWGNLTGNIEEQEDLIELINRKTLDQQSWKDQLSSVISGINDKISNNHRDVLSEIGLLSNKVDSKANSSVIGIIEDKVNNNITEINKLWADVADNSREIANLYKQLSGGEIDTTLLAQVNLNKQNIETLQSKLVNFDAQSINSRISALENRPTVDSSIVSRIQALEDRPDNDTIYDETAIRAELSNIQAIVAQLQREIGSNTITNLIASESVISDLTPNADDISITITAQYSQMKDRDVTDMCEVRSNNNQVAIWNSETKKIEINNDLEETSSANITFTYGGLSVVVSLTVVVEAEEPIIYNKQYVGFASAASQIFENTQFECDSVGKTWNSTTPVYGTPWYYFFVITTQNVASISEIGNYDLNEIRDGQLTSHNGTVYTVYKIGPVSSIEGLNINVTIQ